MKHFKETEKDNIAFVSMISTGYVLRSKIRTVFVKLKSLIIINGAKKTPKLIEVKHNG